MRLARNMLLGGALSIALSSPAAAQSLRPHPDIFVIIAEAYCTDQASIEAVSRAGARGEVAFNQTLKKLSKQQLCEDWRDTQTEYPRETLQYRELIASKDCNFQIYEGRIGDDTTKEGFLLDERGECP